MIGAMRTRFERVELLGIGFASSTQTASRDSNRTIREKGSMEAMTDHPSAIDLTGIESAFALLKISQMFRKMRVGETLEIVGCDPDTRRDMLRVLPASACRWMDGESPDRFFLRKRNDTPCSERKIP
jgi:TusA-related sulfurtransferase